MLEGEITRLYKVLVDEVSPLIGQVRFQQVQLDYSFSTPCQVGKLNSQP